MRYQVLGSLLVVGAIGCGGPEEVIVPDMKVYLDAPVDMPKVCTVATSLGSLTLGMMATPVVPMMGDWFVVAMQGPWMGKTVFAVGAYLPVMSGMPDDVIIVEVVKPANGQWPENTAINFDPSPTALMNAHAIILEDYNQSTGTSNRVLYAGSGSITFTDIGEAANDLVTARVAATTFREVDKMTGADVAGGCTSSLMQFQMYLKQPTNPMRPSSVEGMPEVAPLGAIRVAN